MSTYGRCLLFHRGFKYLVPTSLTTKKCTSTLKIYTTMTPYFIVSQSSVTAQIVGFQHGNRYLTVHTQPPIFYNSIFLKKFFFLCCCSCMTHHHRHHQHQISLVIELFKFTKYLVCLAYTFFSRMLDAFICHVFKDIEMYVFWLFVCLLVGLVG